MRRIYVTLAGLIALLAAGCAGTRPVHFYTLGSDAPRVGQSAPNGPTVVVGNILTSESLEDVRIRYRAGHEVGAYEYHHWTERPVNLVRDELVRALRASGNYGRVLETSSSASGDYSLHGRLYEFEEVDRPAIGVKISLRLELADKKTGRTLWEGHLEREEPSSGKAINDIVDAMDRDLRDIAKQASAAIGASLQPR